MITLGVIPARGGSKSVPFKNIRELSGRPLIAYTIDSAKAAKTLSRVIVSTDSLKIADLARDCGCEVVMRPEELASDTAPTELALIHALDHLEKEDNFKPDIVLTLEPTSPFRSASLIDKCIDIFNSTDADSVIGVSESKSCYGKIIKGKFEFLVPGQPRRRQERKPLYKESSTIYATSTKVLRKKKSVLGDILYPVVVSQLEAVDINTETDFCVVEALMNLKKEGKYD